MDSKIELINSIGKIIVFMMWLLSAFLLTVKSSKKLSNQLFALFLIVTSIDFTGLFINYRFESYPILVSIKTATALLQMPLLYLYVLSVCYSNFKLRFQYLTHSLLFLIFTVVFIMTSKSDLSFDIFLIVAELQWFAYIIAIFIFLKKYKTIYKENYSNPAHLNYRWITQIIIIFSAAHIFVLIKWIFEYTDFKYILEIYIIISITALMVITFFVLKAMFTPQLFTGINFSQKPLKPSLKNTKKSDPDDEQTEKLIAYMNTEKPYLDFELTLLKLADQLRMSENDLSILINHHLGKHFFDFINEYRIKEAKELLEDPDNKELTILEIVYEAGFNSKSSFYTAFKKITDQTPTQYRKKALS
ncbi:AraC family transcriptional regulator [Mangrovivirga sp. M17]|uniref:AraC family transcriptional regulator n=1 Tax=Mangrovivirga halotolerans TaxID=2993936 RepID=A0ABT3RUN5_9BACT|nr:AraC family transcriptional regulator [Mangrovivirga halotolerans]MCX2745489.1 AraC family transcriptional regulator [Mangrovivirga halotolerans]